MTVIDGKYLKMKYLKKSNIFMRILTLLLPKFCYSIQEDYRIIIVKYAMFFKSMYVLDCKILSIGLAQSEHDDEYYEDLLKNGEVKGNA